MSNRELLDAMHNPALEQSGYNDVVTQVDFQLSDHPDPRKARKKNIRSAIKALKPTKRFILSPRRWFRGKFRHSKPHECVIDGIDCMASDYGDLFDQYFRDPISLEVTPFKPTAGVLQGKGRDLRGTYFLNT